MSSCDECSGLCNKRSDIFFELDTKRGAIGLELAKRYGKYLKRPEWTEEELRFIGPGLRLMISEGLRIRDIIKQRLAFC